MLTLELSQMKFATTLLSVAPLVLQTLAPTGKTLGPSVKLLLSRPMTFQVFGVMDNCAEAVCAPAPKTKRTSANIHARIASMRRLVCSCSLVLCLIGGASISVVVPLYHLVVPCRSSQAPLCSCQRDRRG